VLLRLPVWAIAVVAACVGAGAFAGVSAATGPVPVLLMPDSVRALIADHIHDAAQAKVERAKPSAVASREASSDTFSGQSPAEAKDTFEDAFAAVAQAEAYSVENAVQDGHVTKVTGEREARVAMDDGSRAVLVSALPLKVEMPSGDVNVDATLKSQGDVYVPEAPRSDYRVAKDLGEGVELVDADVSIAPAGPGVDAAEPQRVGDSVLWANAAADTDFVISPLPDGVETFHQVRSDNAPESFPLDVTVPDGGKVVRSTQLPEALDVQDGDGKVVAQLSPAIAQDADGVNVPVSYSIDEATNRVTIDVPHRDRDVRYPILVDPSFHVWELLEDANAAGNYPGWTYDGNATMSAKAGLGYWGWGIYGWMGADQAFGFADMARWLFRAPGDSTIAAATLRATYYTAAQHSCLFEGIANGSMTAFDSGMTALTNGTDLSVMPYITCAAGADASFGNQSRGMTSSTKGPGNAALFAITAWSPGATVASSPYVDLAYLAASDVVIEDNDAPTIAAMYPGGEIVFDVQDTGTGVKHADTSVNGGDFVGHDFNCAAESAPNWGCHHQRNVEVARTHPGDHVIIDAYDGAGNKHSSGVDIPYWTSIVYGGSDWSINTSAEQASVTATLDSASDATYDSLWAAITPDDQERLSDYWYSITPEIPVDDSDYVRSTPRALGPAPAGQTWSEFADSWAPMVAQNDQDDSQDGFSPISFDWVARMFWGPSSDRHTWKRTCIWYSNQCNGNLRLKGSGGGLQRWDGAGKRLDYPAPSSLRAQRDLIYYTMHTKEHPDRWQASEPAYYFFVGDTNQNGTFVIQYWYFWSFNHYPPLNSSIDDHEGDWEHVDIFFGSDNVPDKVRMYRHGAYGDEFNWGSHEMLYYSDPQHPHEGRHVAAFSARGDHGFYNKCSEQWETPNQFGAIAHDVTCMGGSGGTWVVYAGPKTYRGTRQYSLRKYIDGRNAWACWNGKLGRGDLSPDAPLRQAPLAHGAAALCNRAPGG